MAVTRKNILSDDSIRDKYVRGVKLLKAEASGSSTSDFGVPGPGQPVSTYDLFVIFHHRAMMTLTPPDNQTGRNAAHRGPVFAPWHRTMLMLLEQNLQRVLGDTTFGLPYWSWGDDGDLSPVAQPNSAVWSDQCMGGTGTPVESGPFAFDPNDPTSWRVKIEGTMGMDISPSTSPNDPVFFLNHCNVDRIWESWLRKNDFVYVPAETESNDLAGHRIDDPVISPVNGGTVTPRQVLQISSIYVYDTLP